MAQPSTSGAVLLAPCDHKLRIGCALTTLPVCCSCADKRPVAPAYPVYIDGEGMKMKGKRWSRYCWKCRDFYNFSHHSEREGAGIAVETSTTANMVVTNRETLRSNPLNPLAEPFTRLNTQESRNNDAPESSSLTRQAHNRGQPATPIPIAQRVIQSQQSNNDPRSHPPSSQPNQPSRQVYPLGTREDVEQEDYQSPVGLLFQRAYARFVVAERDRHEHAAILGIPAHTIRTMDPSDRNDTGTGHRGNQGFIGIGQPLYPGTNIQLGYATPAPPVALPPPEPINTVVGPGPNHPQIQDGRNLVDRQQERPQPLTTEELTVSIACLICREQKKDTLFEPCMHVVLCRWCSDVWQANARRVRQLDPANRLPWKCPVCRKGIQQVRRVYI